MNDKIYVYVIGITGYSNFHRLFSNSAVAYSVEDADVVVFTGGSDIHPSLYKQTKNKYVGTNDIIRDLEEVEVFKKCIHNDIPMIGICRG